MATVRQGGVTAARLFGVPFLLVGAYFGYHFVGGLLNPGELTWAGWTLLPLMATAFLVPGWILTVARRRTRLDARRREVVAEMDYWVYTRRETSPLSPDSVVLVCYQQGSTSSSRGALTTSSTTRFEIHVQLETPGRPQVLLALFSDDQKSDALAFATKAAAFLRISVRDRLVEKGEVTAGGVVVTAGEAD